MCLQLGEDAGASELSVLLRSRVVLGCEPAARYPTESLEVSAIGSNRGFVSGEQAVAVREAARFEGRANLPDDLRPLGACGLRGEVQNEHKSKE